MKITRVSQQTSQTQWSLAQSKKKKLNSTAYDTGEVVDESTLSTIEDQSGILAPRNEALSLGLPQIDLAQSSEAPVREPQQIEQQPLDILNTHDAEAWSQWREEHPDIQLDLSGADLHGFDLRRFDLSIINLANANLSKAKLSGAILTHTDLSNANLNEAILPDADLSNAILVKTDFRGADLRQAKLIQANLTEADFSEAILQEVDLTKAIITQKTNLTRADLTGATLSGANLIGADLTGADLHGLDLREFDLRGAILAKANLSDTNLQGVNLSEAVLEHADLSRANLNLAILPDAKLSDAILVGTKLKGVDLRKAKLIRANLTNADLSEAILQDVDLTQAISKKTNLTQANLTEATLTGANLRGAIISQTFFLNVDLSRTKGLEKVDHEGPSNIDIDTIARSQGKIPEAFLRSAGVPDIIIDSMLSQANHPIKYHSCFFSYSSKDEVFAKRLYDDLKLLGVHCDYAPESLGSGDDFKKRINEYIQNNDKFLLVLSKNSLESSWVKWEVEIATQKEDQLKQRVLFPFKIDNAVLTTDQEWAEEIRDEDHIGDFCSWQQPGAYLIALAHLLRDLKDGS